MWKGYRRISRGSVFLLAMVALVALLFLGTSLVEVAIHGLSFASKQQKRAQALALAESGVEMALAKLYDNYELANDELEANGIYTDSYLLGDGTVDYVVTAPFAAIPRSCVIHSTGTTRTKQSETVRVIAVYLDDVSRVFQGAIFSDSDLQLEGGGAVFPDASGAGGTVYAHGDVLFSTEGNQSFEMAPTGEIYCTGDTSFVPTGVPAENVHEHIAPLPMPEIDLEYYKKAVLEEGKGTYFNTRKDFRKESGSGDILDLTPYGSIIFVKGDVTISGDYKGSVVIVATGKITITGKLAPVDPATDAIALVSPKSVTIAGGANTEVHGLIYAHGIQITDQGGIEASGGATIYGAVVADTVRTRGSLTVYYERVWEGLDVPGKGKSQYQQISWEELLNN